MSEGRVAVFVFRAIERLFCALSLRKAQAVGRGLGWIYGSVIRYHRQDAREALARSLPETSPAERTRILRAMYANLGMTVAEALRLRRLTDEELDRTVRIVNRHYAQEIYDEGNGLLVVTGHVGNWEMLCNLVPRLGFPLSAVVKPIRPPALNDYVARIRGQYGLKLLPPQNSYRQCLRAVKKGEVLGFIIDQNRTRSEGVFVDFFGRPACTTPGLAYLSAQLQVPVVPVFNLRQPDGMFEIQCHPPIAPPADRSEDAIRDATQTYTQVVEDVIRRHPDQWTWIHRRWRTRPADESDG